MKTFFITFASVLFKKLANELRDGFNPHVAGSVQNCHDAELIF